MKCHICDATLRAEDVQFHPLHNDWDPCPYCLEVISGVFNDDSDEEITEMVEHEWFMLYGQYLTDPVEPEIFDETVKKT